MVQPACVLGVGWVLGVLPTTTGGSDSGVLWCA